MHKVKVHIELLYHSSSTAPNVKFKSQIQCQVTKLFISVHTNSVLFKASLSGILMTEFVLPQWWSITAAGSIGVQPTVAAFQHRPATDVYAILVTLGMASAVEVPDCKMTLCHLCLFGSSSFPPLSIFPLLYFYLVCLLG